MLPRNSSAAIARAATAGPPRQHHAIAKSPRRVYECAHAVVANQQTNTSPRNTQNVLATPSNAPRTASRAAVLGPAALGARTPHRLVSDRARHEARDGCSRAKGATRGGACGCLRRAAACAGEAGARHGGAGRGAVLWGGGGRPHKRCAARFVAACGCPLPGGTWGCSFPGLHWAAWGCPGLSGAAWGCSRLLETARDCSGLLGLPKTAQGCWGCSRLLKTVRGCLARAS